MSSPVRPRRQASPTAAPPFWHMTARTAAVAAVVMLSLHSTAMLTAAGVLAAGTAIAAEAEARFRSRYGRSSELADLITMALALAAVLTCILALAAASQSR